MRLIKSRYAIGWVVCGAMSVSGFAAEPEPAPAAPSEAPLAAVWVPHEVSFVYMGFTSYYSCDGLESKLKLLLKASGARADLRVIASCSNMTGGPSRLSSARLRFSTLAIEPPPDTKETLLPALSEWRRVVFRDRLPAGLTDGDCELVEQFDRELLPLFTVRDRLSQMNCIPHQVSMAGLRLQFTVLAPVPEPKAP